MKSLIPLTIGQDYFNEFDSLNPKSINLENFKLAYSNISSEYKLLASKLSPEPFGEFLIEFSFKFGVVRYNVISKEVDDRCHFFCYSKESDKYPSFFHEVHSMATWDFTETQLCQQLYACLIKSLLVRRVVENWLNEQAQDYSLIACRIARIK